MIVLCECRFCGQPVEYDARGVRWHSACAAQYDRQTRGHVIGIMVTMGVVSLILFAMLGLLAL